MKYKRIFFKSTNTFFILLGIFTLLARGSQGQTYGIVGDSGRANSLVAAARDSLAKNNVFSLIIPGDNIYDTIFQSYSSLWGPWKTRGFRFDIVSLGNHNKSYSEEISYFQMPGEYYTKVAGETRFIVLNSDNNRKATEQGDWAEKILASANEKFIFLVYHHPSYTITTSHTWTEKKDFQNRMRKILVKYRSKITALLLGHDHISSIIDFGGTPAVVAGGAGEQRYADPVSYTAEDRSLIQTGWLYSREPSWAKMDIDSSGFVWINFIHSTTQRILCTARIAPGSPYYEKNCASSLGEHLDSNECELEEEEGEE